MSLQIGDTTTNAATTTLQDTNSDVYFDTTLLWRATQTSSWSCILGTKVGTGNVAGAKNGCTIALGATCIPRGLCKWYDCKFIKTSTPFATTLGADDNGSEIIGCTFLDTGLSNFALGTATQRFSNIYNVNIFGSGVLSVTNWGAVAADSIKVANATPTAFFRTTAANIQIKNALFTGAPTTSDWSWTNVGATNWVLVRPSYSGAIAKFSQAAGGSMAVANGAKEYWLWQAKAVDSTGAAVANIPYKVTDTLGNALIDTTTASDGTISYGSGLTANAIIFMDHYTVSQVYTQRHRAPFLVEVNTGTDKNTSYPSQRYYVYPPGYESVTTSAGTFADVYDLVPLANAAGAPTQWLEDEMP